MSSFIYFTRAADAEVDYTPAQWAALDARQIANITTWLNGRAGL